MPSILYELFNTHLQLDEKTTQAFLRELQALFKKFKEHDDTDYVRVLRNKLEHLVERNRAKKTNKTIKKQLKKIDEFIEELSEYIDEKSEKSKQEQLIDVVKEVEEHYTACKNISKKKRDKYTSVCVKKSKIEYEKEIIKMQLELVKLQKHIKDTGEKLLIIFEGRDAAGK